MHFLKSNFIAHSQKKKKREREGGRKGGWKKKNPSHTYIVYFGNRRLYDSVQFACVLSFKWRGVGGAFPETAKNDLYVHIFK